MNLRQLAPFALIAGVFGLASRTPRENPDFFRDKKGRVHPIRDSAGYQLSFEDLPKHEEHAEASTPTARKARHTGSGTAATGKVRKQEAEKTAANVRAFDKAVKDLASDFRLTSTEESAIYRNFQRNGIDADKIAVIHRWTKATRTADPDAKGTALVFEAEHLARSFDWKKPTEKQVREVFEPEMKRLDDAISKAQSGQKLTRQEKEYLEIVMKPRRRELDNQLARVLRQSKAYAGSKERHAGAGTAATAKREALGERSFKPWYHPAGTYEGRKHIVVKAKPDEPNKYPGDTRFTLVQHYSKKSFRRDLTKEEANLYDIYRGSSTGYGHHPVISAVPLARAKELIAERLSR